MIGIRPKSPRDVPQGKYCCGMCGRFSQYRHSAPKPEYCVDCKPEAITLGWLTPPPQKRRTRKKATA